ncbi:N-6 DNA methylase, partial [Hydrogenivirga sp.]
MDFPSYLSSLREVFLSDPREESYYAPLKDLLESAGVKVLIAPSKTSAGFPDLKVFQEDGFIVGYVEGKPPREDLTKVIDSEQIKRYLSHFPNLLLTNFIEFVHFLNGKPTGRAELIAIEDLERGNFKKAKIEETKQLLTNFLNYIQKPITSTQELAKALSWRVRLLKEEIRAELERNQTLKDLFNQIKEYIIHNMSEEDFSDTIAQALAYALLIIRTRREYIRKEEVLTQIPQSLSIVRDIFLEIFRIEGKDIEWILDEIENTLNLFDPRENSLTPEELTIHFYEPFLREYNPDLREIRGVYYTPKPVVSFIVRSVEKALRSSFGFNGYVEETLKLLDPAGGTLTFILETLYRVREEVVETFGEGAVKDYFERVVLENFYAFELLPAPYVIGHLKVGKFLSDLGIEDRKFKLYLTNTLELKHAQIPYLFSHEWAKEIQSADRVKTQENILVVIGNPPYSGISANNQKDIVEFLKKDVDGCQSYYRVDGKDLKTFLEELSRTKKVKVWLQDDYVKFIRFAQWKIERSGKGVVGYITNHSYIDNPTFAGMRQSLLKTFDRIYILDLHGNKRKKEPDENVFDIQQGVAIGIFVKDGS